MEPGTRTKGRTVSFSIELASEGRFRLHGQLLASEVAVAADALATIDGPCTLDLADLAYVSSAGLRLFLQTQARLMEHGHALRLVNLNDHLLDLFAVTGLSQVFDIAAE
jgi:anti-anti-sigma factor